MRFRRYGVTVTDNWTSMRTFFTYEKACMYAYQWGIHAHVYHWRKGKWVSVI